MAFRITYTHRCINCYTEFNTFIPGTTRRYENTGLIFDENELENINVVNNIVHCRACGTSLGIKRIDNNDIILFKRYLRAEAYIQTHF